MKIMLWSNAPWENTGYGRQAKELLARLQQIGHEIAVQSLAGLSGAALDWGGVTIYPIGQYPLGLDMIGPSAAHFGADVVISLYDIWAFPVDVRGLFGPPWVALIPVDGAPASERMLRRIRTVDYPVAYSLFGKHELQEAGIEADYIPHGIDCDVFCPGDKVAARQRLGIPQDVFLVTMVAANKDFPSRKSFPEVLTAFAGFHKRNPDALLYLHTTRVPLATRQGIHFDPLASALKIESAVTYADPTELAIGIPDEQMASIYRASDVLLNPAMGEGFCLPVIEAQACGCPVITQDCSAMSELTKNGITIEPLQAVWMPHLDYWWQAADVGAIDDALEHVLLNWALDSDNCRRKAVEGVNFIRENYSWVAIVNEYWQPFLEKIGLEI